MQFRGNFGKFMCWRCPPLPRRVGAPTSGKSWIRHCISLIFFDYMQFSGKKSQIKGSRLFIWIHFFVLDIRHMNFETRELMLKCWINYDNYLDCNSWFDLNFPRTRVKVIWDPLPGHVTSLRSKWCVNVSNVPAFRIQQSILTISSSVETLIRIYYMNIESQLLIKYVHV